MLEDLKNPVNTRKEYSQVFQRKSLLAFFLLAILTTVTGQLFAQSAPWRAWLFNAADGSIRIADQTGTIVDGYTLPLSQAFNTYDEPVTVSASGRYVAFVAYDSTSENSSTQLFVYDHAVQTTRFAYDITGYDALSFEFLNTPLAFDETGERFAFAVLDEELSWQIVVADLTAGTTQAIGQAASAPELVDYALNYLPVIQQLSGTRVTFALLPYGGEFEASYPAFTWDFLLGTATPEPTYASLVTDSTADGHRVVARFDDSLPAADENGDVPVLMLNMLEVIDPRGEVTTQYNETDGTIERVLFIEDGQRTVVQVRETGSDEPVLKIINADGTVADELIGALDDLQGTPDGFVGLFDNDGVPAMAYVNTASDMPAPAVIWSSDSDVPLRLVRVAD
jgi:hypothetical protein